MTRRILVSAAIASLFRRSIQIRSTREYRIARVAIAACVIGSVGILGLFWRSIPPQVPIWYSTPWAADRLARPIFLLLPTVSSLLIYFLNIIVADRFLNEHPMFSRILVLTSSVISLISLYTVGNIVFVVLT